MVNIKGINFDVVITKKRIKNIYLKVNKTTIEASCPYYVAQYEVYKLIAQTAYYLQKAQIEVQDKLKIVDLVIELVDVNHLHLLVRYYVCSVHQILVYSNSANVIEI